MRNREIAQAMYYDELKEDELEFLLNYNRVLFNNGFDDTDTLRAKIIYLTDLLNGKQKDS